MNTYLYNGQVVTASSKSEVLASSFDYIGTTDSKDNTILCQGQNKNAVDKLFDKIEELDDVNMHTSFHNLIQLNYDDELPDEVMNLLNNKREFKILKKQDNQKLQNQLEELEDLFRKENLSITGDMSLAFQDSSDIPAYVDHFCVTFNENKKNEKEYLIVCADGGFDIHDYEDEKAANILTFEKAKEKCQKLIDKYIRKVTSSSEVLAFNKDRISDEVKEAYDALNERFTDNYTKIKKSSNCKINEKELAYYIVEYIESNEKLTFRLSNKKVSNTSILWDGLHGLFKQYLKGHGGSKIDLSSEQLKNWFAYNGTDYKTALKQAVTKINNLRQDEYLV